MNGKITKVCFAILFIFSLAVPSLAKYHGRTGKTTTKVKTKAAFPAAGRAFADKKIKGTEDILKLYNPENSKQLNGGKYSGGTGEPNDPYLIATPEDLNSIGLDANDWDKHFKMIADIDLAGYTGTQFNIIGKYVGFNDPENEPFTGTFDGNGHTISNFSYDLHDDGIGLFSYVAGESAMIKNLGLTEPNVRGFDYTGALVGLIEDGTIRGCYVSDGAIHGSEAVGGLIGSSDDGCIYDCFAQTTVQGSYWIGVLTGESSGEIVCCYSGGSALGQYGVGGLIGRVAWGASHCYSTASAQGNGDVGGLTGVGSGTFKNCFAAGSVTGDWDIGGLVGDGEPTVYDCFWDYQTTGQTSSVGGGTMLTTAQMQDIANFQAQGWDFVGSTDGPSDLWAMPDTAGYPMLWWQLEPLPELPEFSGGSGLENNPYIISTAADLRSIRNNPRLLNSHFKIVNDIDLAAVPFYTIAKTQPRMKYFAYRGVFDGNNHTISNLYCPSDKGNQTGLFGDALGETSLIKNVVLVNVDVNAPSWSFVGALASTSIEAQIQDCHIKGARIVGDKFVGGFVGGNGDGSVYRCSISNINVVGSFNIGGFTGSNAYGSVYRCSVSDMNVVGNSYVVGGSNVGGFAGLNAFGAEIINCSAEGAVSGTDGVSGFVSQHHLSSIQNCYADVNVTASGKWVGGFVAHSHGTLRDCYSQGQVRGLEWVGGMFGVFDLSGIEPNCINCYTTCQVEGNEHIGGFAGGVSSVNIAGCFWDSEINPGLGGFGYIQDYNNLDVTGLPTELMQTESTFTDAGWDFVGETTNGTDDIWKLYGTGKYPQLAWEKYSGGTGGPNDPYLIASPEDLNSIGLDANDWDKHFKMIADIDLASYDGRDGRPDFIPIGKRDMYGPTPFTGVFDGNGHTIQNFTFVNYKPYKGGIFASFDAPGEIKNVTMTNPLMNVPNQFMMAALVSRSEGGTIRNCHILGGSFVGDDYIGPLVGDNWADIYECSASSPVSGYDHVGGLVGRNQGRIYSSFATGSVTGTILVGGLTGRCSDAFDSYGIIQNCYATGDVSGDYTGGLVGQLWGGLISNSYSVGHASGIEAIGGLVGEIVSGGSVLQSFWDTQTSDCNVSDGGTGKTTAEMQMQSTFTDAGWDFVGETINGANDIWSIREGQDYPRLFVPSITGWEIAATHGGGLGEIWCPVDEGYIESRVSGISKLCVCFNRPMDTNVTDANEVSIFGANSGMQPAPCSIEWDGVDCMIITMCSALPDQDTYTIIIGTEVVSSSGYALEGDRDICLTALKGDANRSRSVNAQDLLAIRQYAGQTIDCGNARYDINCSGGINAQDMLAARQYAGNGVPECPFPE